ncbi:MAG: hydroxymethylbilane synthase [bacterium]|nr:hydroxymethylbilane synthase [bacterium]
MKEIIVGSRGSKLALTQTELVVEKLKEIKKNCSFVIKTIKTEGDKLLNSPLSKIGGKGLFVKEIEEELIERKIDIAVHSMKDIPCQFPPELIISSVPSRKNPKDALISKNNKKLQELSPWATIGTSSLRRKAQLLIFRKDLKVIDLRGNLDTRFKKFQEENFEAIIVAASGLIRLNLSEKITQELPLKDFLPAAGQGALGIEIRKDNFEVKELVEKINCYNSYQEVVAERAFLKKLGGGCQVPIGVIAQAEDRELYLEGMVSSLDGKEVVRGKISGRIIEAETLGEKLAYTLLKKGAKEILLKALT